MNGFPLAGRPLKVGRSERSACFPDSGEMDNVPTSPSQTGAMLPQYAESMAAAAGQLSALNIIRHSVCH
jgi:hypothetical protein